MSRRLAVLSSVFFACSLQLAVASAALAQQAPRLVLSDDSVELEKALAAPSAARDLPVRLAAVSLPGDDGGAVRLLITAAIDDPREGPTLASVAYSLLDEKGGRQAHALRRGELPAMRPGSLSFVEMVPISPGSYRLRVAALRNGRVGSAELTVAARLRAAGTLRIGDLLVGMVAGEEAVSTFAPEPTVRGDRVVVTLPVAVGQAMPAGMTITLDVASDAAGATLVSAPIALVVGQSGVPLAQGVVDARVLPSGSYVARVAIALSGHEVARLVAPFSLDRTSSVATPDAGRGAVPGPAGSTSAPATGAPALAAGFRLEEVLDAAVVAPFLNDLAARGPEARPAIEQARAGRFADAARSAAARDPHGAARPFLEGLSLLSQKQLQAASEAFRETLRAAPDYFAGAFYIGACYAAGGRDPQAVNAWQTSLVGLDQYPIVFRLIADALLRMRQTARAVETLEEATAKWPDDSDLRLRLARAALEGRMYDRVEAVVDAALTRPPADAELLFAGMQAVFERVTQGTVAARAEDLARLNGYREAYAAAGGSRQSLVNEWVSAVEKKAARTVR